MSELNIEEIIKMYTIDKKSLKDIAKVFNVSYGTIRNRLVKNNIPIRTRSEVKRLKDLEAPCSGNGRRYSLNFDYFKHWNRDMAYILGFIGADGSIDKNCIFMKITLQENDIDILEKIKDKIEFTGKISKH